jgi:hypothetical protein
MAAKRLPSARAAVVEMLRDPANSARRAAGPEALEGPQRPGHPDLARPEPARGVQPSPPLQGEPVPVLHSVRYYEKGESPLEYLTTRQWFVRLTDKKDRLLEMG